MDGMGMLLKAAGFDAAQFQSFVAGMQATLQKFNADLEQLKSCQAEMLNRLAQLESDQRVQRILTADRSNENG